MILPNRVTDWVNPDGYCFGCKERLGTSHKPDCVAYKRTIVVEVKIPLIITVPVSWDSEAIEFFYAESSHCLSNIADEIWHLRDRLEKDGSCMCNLPEDGDGISFRREATEEDHKKFALPLPQDAEDLP